MQWSSDSVDPSQRQWIGDSNASPVQETWDDDTGEWIVDPRDADPVINAYDDDDDMGSDSHGTSSCGSPAAVGPHYPFAHEHGTDDCAEQGAHYGDAGCTVVNAPGDGSIGGGAHGSENTDDLLEQSESDV